MSKLNKYLELHKIIEVVEAFDIRFNDIIRMHDVDAKIVRKLQSMGCEIKESNTFPETHTANLLYKEKQIGVLFCKKKLTKGDKNYFADLEAKL